MSEPACTQKHVRITRADLPLSCPSRHQTVWNAHPRIYLDIEAQGYITCPYCGTHYQLVD